MRNRVKLNQQFLQAKVVAVKKDGRYIDFHQDGAITGHLEYVDTSSLEGIRIYRDSLVYVLIKAAQDLFPLRKLRVYYSIHKGAFCGFQDEPAQEGDVERISRRMREIISKDIPFRLHRFSKEQALSTLRENGKEETASVLENLDQSEITLHSVDGLYGYFVGQLAPSTGYVDLFDIKPYPPGFILFFPTRFQPYQLPPFQEQKKLSRLFRECSEWGKILDAGDVASLNRHVDQGTIRELILVNEALHEKKIAQIADWIRKLGKKFVMVAGPSSSGKTTFAKRLQIQLMAAGSPSRILSLDDYYKDRDTIPMDIHGERDLESLEALDVGLFQENLRDLSEKGKTDIPRFNFLTQKRNPEFIPLSLAAGNVLIIEGIHALNPELIHSVKRNDVFRIYISALTSINIDDHNRFATTDTRLIRRIARDIRYRGASAEKTITMWPSVRKGEDLYIFPFQEHADMMFNSALVYEHGVLKKFTQSLLNQVGVDSPAHTEASRLNEILTLFRDIGDEAISNTSLLREFIGGSSFL